MFTLPTMDDVTIHGFTGSMTRTNKDTPDEVWQFFFFYPGLKNWIILPASDTREGAIELASNILATREKFGAFLIGHAYEMLVQFRTVGETTEKECRKHLEIVRQEDRQEADRCAVGKRVRIEL